MSHRFTVTTKSNPAGDDVGADEVTILPGGVLGFVIDNKIQLAYAADEWVRYEYEYEEES